MIKQVRGNHLDHHRRFPMKVIGTCNLDSDVARSSKNIQRIDLKPNTQLSRTGRLVTKRSEETLERTKFHRDTLNQEKHDNVTDPSSTGDPYVDTNSKNVARKHVERDQTSTVLDKKEEHKIDFRVPGLSHAVVKEHL